jgi:hypothetical protein
MYQLAGATRPLALADRGVGQRGNELLRGLCGVVGVRNPGSQPRPARV